MVAVPRSKGCLVCRRRSVKCDEARPTCSQCRRGGRQCSGYDLPMKFIFQDPEVNAKKRTSKSRSKKRSGVAGNISGAEIITTVSNLARQNPKHPTSIQRDVDCPKLNLVQLVNSFVNSLFPPEYLVPQLSFFADWLWLVPAYVARNELLDSAAQCLALGFFGYETKNSVLEHEGRRAYSRALLHLSKAIEDAEVGLSSDTLCSTMLLSFYEIYMRTEKVSWVTHAGGAGRLMQIRGAQRHREGFDFIMFLGFRAIIIAEAVSSGRPCFLDSKDWRNVVALSETYTTSSVTFQLHDQFSVIFAQVPGVAKRLSDIVGENRTTLYCSPALEGAVYLRNNFKAWHRKFISKFPDSALVPTNISPNGETSMIPTPYDSQKVWAAAWLCSYYACLIMLNTRISQLSDLDTSMENSQLIGKLCIAVGHCARVGNSGGQCLAFALPVAMSLCKDELNGWFEESLANLEGRKGVSEEQIAMLRTFVRVKL